MKYNEMTKNFIFRFYKCNLTLEETAELCFKSVTTVKNWDKGKTIPPECKRLMKLSKSRKLHHSKEWDQFKMVGEKLEIPTGRKITPNEILIGIALLEISSDLEIKTSTKLLKLARALSRIDKG